MARDRPARVCMQIFVGAPGAAPHQRRLKARHLRRRRVGRQRRKGGLAVD
jgi:hypothetical protein